MNPLVRKKDALVYSRKERFQEEPWRGRRCCAPWWWSTPGEGWRRTIEKVRVNRQGGPDLLLGSHGLTMAAVQVETEGSITPERAERWRKTAPSGAKLILMVPKGARARVTDLLWQKEIMDRAAVGSYEIRIEMS